ncbi:MAG TPA: hypothetical protein VJY39_11145 [Acidisphaera sp.]|nr:hypothetical protein [Acidisphaera sp.]
MNRILLDQNAPVGLRRALVGYEVSTAFQMGWHALSNGELLAAAETAGFHVMITCGQNIRYEQNMAGRRISLICLSTNNWDIIRNDMSRIVAALGQSQPGAVHLVEFAFPKRRNPTR